MFELIIRTQKHLRLLILEASQMVCLSKCIFNMVLIVILFGFTWVLVLWNILPNTLISAAIQVDIIRLNWNLKLNRRRRTLSTPWDLKKFSCYGNTRNDALCMKKTPSPHSMLYQLIFDVIFSTTRNYNKSEMLFRFWLVCSREERWWSEWRRMQSLLSFGDMSIQLVKLNMLLRNEWSVMVFPHFGGDMNKQNCQILRWSKIIHHFIAAAKLTHHICAPISIPPPRIVYILANADVMCMLWYESRLFGMLFLSISQLFLPPSESLLLHRWPSSLSSMESCVRKFHPSVCHCILLTWIWPLCPTMCINIIQANDESVLACVWYGECGVYERVCECVCVVFF